MKAGLVWLLLVAILPMAIFGLSWRMDITLQDSDESRVLVWGIAPDATSGFDAGIDENFPLIPPSGFYAYFALDDPENPYITMLVQDVRQDEMALHYWRIAFGGTTDPVTVSWDPLALPLGSANIGLGTETTEPAEWNDMSTTSSIVAGIGQYVWIYFVPAASGDDNPPYVVSVDPENGETDVSPTADVQIVLADNETGIDPSSVVLTIDGADVTADATFSRGGNLFTITYTPAGGFAELSTVEVNVYAQEISTDPAALDYSFSFSTGALISPALWEVPIVLTSISSSSDTTEFDLSFGIADDAGEGFDPDYDVPYPMPPGDAFYAYFPLSDPEYPFFSMLTRDIRATGVDNMWKVALGNPGTAILAEWELADLPDSEFLEVGVASPPDEPEMWYDMSTLSELAISSTEWLWIRQTTPPAADTMPPYLVSCVPAVGATGVSLSTNLSITLADDGAGVDASSIVLIVDGEDVTADATITEDDEYVYILYNPPSDFPELYTVNWSVDVSDLNDTPNSTTIEGYFTTGYFPTPLWLGTLVFDITPEGGSPYVVNLTFGTDEAGTDGFDFGLDYVAPPPIPGAPSFYFYITDTLWTQLSQDIRNSADDSIMWVAYCTEIDTDWGAYQVSWDPDSLPAVYLQFAWTDMTSEPTDWTDMSDITSLEIVEDGRLFILYRTAPPTYCLSGVVSLEDETDYSGTIVSIDELGLSDTTDADGNYQICEIEAGTYTVSFEHDGYVADEEELEITGDMVFNITLNLPRYTVEGWVELEGLPDGNWDGTSVQLDASVVTTDTSGYFVFSDILAGEYYFHAEHEGYAPLETTIVVDGDVSLALSLSPVGTVVVYVDLEGDGDLSGTSVTLHTAAGDSVQLTDPDGYATFPDVYYGEYAISVDRSGYESDSLFVVLDSPAETVSTTLNLLRGIIEGYAMLSDSPIDLSGTVVTLDDTVAVTYTDITGYYSFDNVLYGSHHLFFTHDGYNSVDTTVTLGAPGTLEVDVMLIRPAPVLNPPRDLQTFSRHHNRISIRWVEPEATEAHLIGYGVVRAWVNPADTTTIATLPKFTTSYIDTDVSTGMFDYYWYRVYAIYEEGVSEAIGPRVAWAGDDPTEPDVLLVDFDNGALLANGASQDEANYIEWLFGQVNMDGEQIIVQTTNQDQDLDDYELSIYRAVFIITGIYDSDDTPLSATSLTKLLDYLGAGGRIYWEGADVAFDYESALDGELMSRMGVSMADDGNGRGMGNIVTLNGSTPFFFNDISIHYDYRTWADHWVDELSTVGSGFAIMNSQEDPAPNVSTIRMVANDGTEAEFDSHWRNVVSSAYLGAMQWSDDVNCPWEVLRGIWSFLTGQDIGPWTSIAGGKPKRPVDVAVNITPTPFNSALSIDVSIKSPMNVELTINDISGRRIATLADEKLNTGSYSYKWNAEDAPSGVYLIVLNSDGGNVVKRAILVR